MIHQGTSTPSGPPLLVIVGASARAMAQSAVAAGWRVGAIDLFRDVDLQATAARAVRIAPSVYPHGLVDATAAMPDGPWCYTGALENHPDLVAAIAAARPLAGNSAAALRVVRDPARMGRIIRSAGLDFPDTRASPDDVPVDGSFLVKPIASAAGRGIHRWNGAGRAVAGGRHVWQRHVDGVPHAAAFVCDAREARLLGLSRQWIGEPWCHAGAFAYCGSVSAPASTLGGVDPEFLTRLGTALVDRFGLIGVIGVDLIVAADGRPWVIEINPRYTASMELHERTTGRPVVEAHLRACGFPSPDAPRRPPSSAVWAKAVVHAPHAVGVTEPLVAGWRRHSERWEVDDGGWPPLADIPDVGQTIPHRHPLLTVFAAGSSPAAAGGEVVRRVAEILAVSRPSAAASAPPSHATHTA